MALDDSGTIYTIFRPGLSSTIYTAYSTDSGVNWTKYDHAGTNMIGNPIDIAADHRGNIWILWLSVDDYSDIFYINLSKSADSGRTFALMFQSRAYADGSFNEKLAVDGQNNIHILWDDSYFKLTTFRQGDTTQRVDAEIPHAGLGIDSHPVLAVSNDLVVHVAWEGFYYDSVSNLHIWIFYSRSSDLGMTFQRTTRVDSSDYYQDYPALTVDSIGRIFVSYSHGTALNSEISLTKSTNGGQSFELPLLISGIDTAYESVLCVDSENGVNIVWSSHGHPRRHYRSSDGGISFAEFAPFPPIGVSDFKAGKKGSVYLTGANDSGFGFAKTSVILSVPYSKVEPNTFNLYPNYPNPFNPSTTIRFSIGKAGMVDMKIYDIIGREVGVLLSKHLSPGLYSATWDATGYSSGVYFVRLVAGDNIIFTRKMILMR